MTSSFEDFLREVERITEAALEGIAVDPPPDIWAARDSMMVDDQEDPGAEYLLRQHLDLLLVELGEAAPEARPAIGCDILRCVQGGRLPDQVVFMEQSFADLFPPDVATDLERLASGDIADVDPDRILARMPPGGETVGVELAHQICHCGKTAGLHRDWPLSYTGSPNKEVKWVALAQHLGALWACFRGEAPVFVSYWWDGRRAQLRVTPLAGSLPNEQTTERRPRLP